MNFKLEYKNQRGKEECVVTCNRKKLWLNNKKLTLGEIIRAAKKMSKASK